MPPSLCLAAVLSLGALGCSSGDPGDDDTTSSPPAASPSPSPSPSVAAEILIDDAGIPHIYAATDEDLFFAAGYQVAVDRLFQMETLRRFAYGRLSEVVGEEALTRDVEARTFDFPRWGRLDWELMQLEDPERAALYRAWIRGINQRIDEVTDGTAPLPFGYRADEWDFLPERWDEADACIVLKGAGFALDMTIAFEFAVTFLYTLYPEAMASIEILKPAHPVYAVPEDERPTTGLERTGRLLPASPARALAPPLAPPPDLPALRKALDTAKRWLTAFPRASGSNNWALDGRHTADGRPLLAGDPHLSFDFFGAPYPMHLNSADAGGNYDVAGFNYPGTPGIAIGFNDRLIWTPTSAFGDVMDLWALEIEGDQANLGGEWRPVVRREEEILVRDPGMPAGVGRVETRTFEEIDGYGMLVPGEVFGVPFMGPLLCNWSGFTGRPARWFMELNTVKSIPEFEAAVDRMREMNYNFVAADASGIALRVGVDVPRRTDVTGNRAPWLALDGADPLSLWPGGMLEREQLPRARGATAGWLATANNDPFGFTGDGRIDDDPWYYGAFFDPGYRASRITAELERLTARGDVTLEDMQRLQMDTRSTLADDLLPLIEAAWARVDEDPSLEPFRGRTDVAQVVALLSAWDRRMARDSAGALAFQAWLHFVTEATIGDDIPAAYDFSMELQAVYVMKVAALALSHAYPQGDAVLQEGRDFLLLDAVAATADWLETRYGALDEAAFAYGDLKQTRFDDAFGYLMPVFSKPTDGGEDTLCVSQNISFAPKSEAWVSTYVSVERMVGGFDEDGRPEVWVNYPVGPASDPESVDTAMANADYLEGRYRRFRFTRDEIEGALRERRTLSRLP